MEKVHTSIEHSIAHKKKGQLIFPSDFRGAGTDDAIKKSLSRLAKKGSIKRLAHGIYYVPKTDPVLGPIRPGADEVVRMIAQREKIRVRPAGASAMHQLGLTTQVPTKLVYLTDGNAKQFKLGKLQIKFVPTTAKKLATTGDISSLIIQVLEETGPDNIPIETAQKMKELLKKEDPSKLKKDLSLASAKVNDYIVRLIR